MIASKYVIFFPHSSPSSAILQAYLISHQHFHWLIYIHMTVTLILYFILLKQYIILRMFYIKYKKKHFALFILLTQLTFRTASCHIINHSYTFLFFQLFFIFIYSAPSFFFFLCLLCIMNLHRYGKPIPQKMEFFFFFFSKRDRIQTS